MKRIIISLIIFLPPPILVYLLAVIPVRSICYGGDFSWLPIPTCSFNIGKALEAQGFSSTISGNLLDCDEVEKGWCVVDYTGQVVETFLKDNSKIIWQTATVTPKGFNL